LYSDLVREHNFKFIQTFAQKNLLLQVLPMDWKSYARRFLPAQEYPQLWTQTGKLPWLPETEKVAKRLKLALEKNQKICIYSDYDTDAVTATCVMYRGLCALGFNSKNISYYAPDRFTEGYGMNTEAIRELSTLYDVIISVDCGINSVAEAEIVLKSKADLIITDHHHLSSDIPKAIAVLNPRLCAHYYYQLPLFAARGNNVAEIPDDPKKWMSESITGVGVSWFTLLYTAQWWKKWKFGTTEQTDLKQFEWLLPVVAIGTVADCQSIIDPQNRVIVRAGLAVWNKYPTKVPGVQTLMKAAGISEKMANGYQLSSQDLAFTFSPILNSSGRLTHAKLSIEVMLSDDPSTAAQLVEINNERKALVKSIVEELDAEASAQAQAGNTLLWLTGPWSKGLVGLLASRLEAKFNLPTAVLSIDPEHPESVSASLRAPEGYHWPHILAKLSPGLLTKFGGHPQAAGFGTSSKNVSQIYTELQLLIKKPEIIVGKKWYEGQLPKELESLAVDSSMLILKDVPSETFLSEVWQLDPFGQDLPFPGIVFKLPTGTVQWMKEQQHAKLLSGDIGLLWFNLADQDRMYIESWGKGATLWVQTQITQNAWKGTLKHELIIQKAWLL
jgi:single-stranded-DNA-specific exonuclease